MTDIYVMEHTCKKRELQYALDKKNGNFSLE